MKILLTGATGFLGSHIAELLMRQGYEIRCLVRKTSDTRFLQSLSSVELIEASLTDLNSLGYAVKGVDAIIHNAAITSAIRVENFYSNNVDSTATLLEAAKRFAPNLQRFVFTSSLAAAGPAISTQPHDENIVPNPVSHYGRSKLLAELKVRDYADTFPIVIVRPPAIFGPRDKDMFLFFKAMQRGFAFLPAGGQMRLSTIYVEDAAAAIVKTLTAPVSSGSTYFINDGHIFSWSELIAQLAESFGRASYIKINVPISMLKIIAFFSDHYGRVMKKSTLISIDKVKELEQLNWTCHSDKAQIELNWRPHFNWRTGTALTYEWYKKVGWL